MTVLFATWRRTLWVIFSVALAARLGFVFVLQRGFYFPDSIRYSEVALDLLTNGGFGADYSRAPGYPLFLAAVYALFGESIIAVRVIESLLGALLSVLIARIGKRVGGKAVGIISGGLWSVYPLGIFIVGLVYPTNLAAFLLALGLSFVLPSPDEKFHLYRVFTGGLSYGFAALTIPVALLTICFVSAWIVYWARPSPLRITFGFILGSVLIILPWTARSFIVHGRLVPIQSNIERHLPQISSGDSASADRMTGILRRPDLFLVHFGRNFISFWELYPSRVKMNDQNYRERLHAKDSRVVKESIYTGNPVINVISILSVVPMLLFAILGVGAMSIRKELHRDRSIFLSMIFSFAVGYAFFVGKIRYRIPVEPFIIIFSAYGIKVACSAFGARFQSFLLPIKEDTEGAR